MLNKRRLIVHDVERTTFLVASESSSSGNGISTIYEKLSDPRKSSLSFLIFEKEREAARRGKAH